MFLAMGILYVRFILSYHILVCVSFIHMPYNYIIIISLNMIVFILCISANFFFFLNYLRGEYPNFHKIPELPQNIW